MPRRSKACEATAWPHVSAVVDWTLNSTVKNELLHGKTFTGIRQVTDAVRKAVKFYNEERPHSSIDMLTPDQAHRTEGKLKKHWHSYRDDAIEELQKAAV